MNLHPRKQMHSTCPERNKCETSLYSVARNLNLTDKQTEGKNLSQSGGFFFSNEFSQFKGGCWGWNYEEEIIPMHCFSPLDPWFSRCQEERRSQLMLLTVLEGSQPTKPSTAFCLSVLLCLTPGWQAASHSL